MKNITRREYDEAMRRFLSKVPFDFKWVDGRRPARDELYDRTAIAVAADRGVRA